MPIQITTTYLDDDDNTQLTGTFWQVIVRGVPGTERFFRNKGRALIFARDAFDDLNTNSVTVNKLTV